MVAALFLALISASVGAQSLLRVSDDSYRSGLDRFKKGDMVGAIADFNQALEAYLSDRAGIWRRQR